MKTGMEIIDGCFAHGLCLYIERLNILAISDTHIGYEEALNRQGILIPRFQFKEMLVRFERAVSDIQQQHHIKNFSKVIIDGDLKHEFGTISGQEWRHSLKLIDFLLGFSDELILVKGNHDTILGPIAGKRGVKIKECHLEGDFLFTHGDKIPDAGALKAVKALIIGHEHPAISIKEGARAELFKCFLRGRWKGRNLIVLPSFNLVTEGHDLLRELPISPFLTKGIGDFSAFAVGDVVYPPLTIRSLQ